MSQSVIDNSEKIDKLNSTIKELLAQYRAKHDELQLATEEWDIGEIQEDLASYTVEINKLKKKVHELKEQS
jgi:uncharacterized coiled-coil DUF342 family protein